MLCGSLDERGVWGRMDTCVCMAESLHCPPEIMTTLLIGCTPIQNTFFFLIYFNEQNRQKSVSEVLFSWRHERSKEMITWTSIAYSKCLKEQVGAKTLRWVCTWACGEAREFGAQWTWETRRGEDWGIDGPRRGQALLLWAKQGDFVLERNMM